MQNQISPEFIVNYLKDKFPGTWRINGNELLLNSPFNKQDYKQHFSLNIQSGLWQDFKAGRSGNFIQLYSYLEGVSYHQAEIKLLLNSLFKNEQKQEEYQALKQSFLGVERESEFSWFGPESEISSPLLEKAYRFVVSRKIFDLEGPKFRQFAVSKSGKFSNRLIIPYRSDSGNLIYFQARTLDSATPKYLNPNKFESLGSSNVLYPFNKLHHSVVVCEGPIDAISLQRRGVNATCINGCSVSVEQFKQLAEARINIIVGFDNDNAGKKGLQKFSTMRKRFRLLPVFRCFPPSEFKDWNEAHIANYDIHNHILAFSEVYDDFKDIEDEIRALK